MTFECQSVWNWANIDELVDDYPCLKDYGVKAVTKTSMRGYETNRIEITINSLEELMDLANRVGFPLILKANENCIEIYDGYRE